MNTASLGGLNDQFRAALAERYGWLSEGILKPEDPGNIGRNTHPNHLQYKKSVFEILCHNMDRWLQGDTHLDEAGTTTANIQAFQSFAYPLLRRVFPRLIALDLVSVQPLTQPTGLVYFLNAKKDNAGGAGADADGARLDASGSWNATYADNATEAGAVKAIRIDMDKTTVTAVAKKLKAVWTIEAEQDFKSVHGLDVGSELIAYMADEIAREIDIKIIADLYTAATAATSEGVQAGAGNVNFTKTAPLIGGTGAVDYVNQSVYDKRLFGAVVDATNLVYKLTYRRPNWLLCHPDEGARFEKMEDFKISVQPQPNRLSLDRHYLGTLQNRWDVYTSLNAQANKILVGYRGESWLETGYAFCPYIPLYVTAPFTDPATFETRRGIMTRSAYKVTNASFYSTVTLV